LKIELKNVCFLLLIVICLMKKNLLDSLRLWVNFEFLLSINISEAKWRVERSFRTHQDRLVKKLRLAWIKSVPKASSYLKDTYIPEHNIFLNIIKNTTLKLYLIKIYISHFLIKKKPISTGTLPKKVPERSEEMVLFIIITKFIKSRNQK